MGDLLEKLLGWLSGKLFVLFGFGAVLSIVWWLFSGSMFRGFMYGALLAIVCMSICPALALLGSILNSRNKA